MRLFLFGLLIVALSSCQSDSKDNSSTTVQEPAIGAKNYPVPKFDRDSALQFVQQQVDFGPRVPNSEAHQACKEWLVSKFKSYGADVIEQDFVAKAYTGTELNSTNIIAQFNKSASKRIVLAAHWDSRHIADSPLSTERKNEPILGADDGGSGVGVLLEVARQISANPTEMGVDIVLFDAEDHGESKEEYANEQEAEQSTLTWALGSQHWARNLHVNGYRPKYGILLDMVGSRNAYFPKEQYSRQFAPQLVEKVWKLAANMGYGSYFANVDGGGVTDDHVFVASYAKIPMIDIINLPPDSDNKGFGSHWHTHQDNMQVIDKRTLRAVGQVVLAVVYREASGKF